MASSINSFSYKDTPVFIRKMTFRERNHEDGQTCFCCQEEFKENDQLTLLINNHKYFPNMILHQECFEFWEKRTDELCDDIVSAYEQCKQLQNIFQLE